MRGFAAFEETVAFAVLCCAMTWIAVNVEPDTTRPEDHWRRARLCEECCLPGCRLGVVDGDTFDLVVEHSWGGHVERWPVRVRLADVDAPETRGPERERGLEAAEVARKWFGACASASSERYPLDVHSESAGSFGRPLTEIRCQGESLADHLRAKGMAGE